MKIIVITGGSSGIGKELVNLYVKNGDKVFSLSRTNPENYENFIRCDVGKNEEVEAAIAEITKNGETIDVLINNAGIGVNSAVEFLSEESYKLGMDVNLSGVYYVTKATLPHLSEFGKIINISSACALFALPFKSVYCSSKAGVNMLTYSLHMELFDTGIQVCAICPGDTKSGFSKNRVKEFETNERYGTRIKDAADKLDAREERRMPASKVAEKIFKVAEKKRIPVLKIIGIKYKLFYIASKILPTALFLNMTNYLLGK